MKSAEEILRKIDSIEDSLTVLNEQLGECYDEDESFALSLDIEVLEGRRDILKWVLNLRT